MIMLLSISVALVAGLMMTRLFKRFHLPDVTSYLIAGVLLGPCIIGRLGIPGVGFTSFELVDSLQPICDVALGFIAFAIGSEFRLSSLRTTGRAAVIVGLCRYAFGGRCAFGTAHLPGRQTSCLRSHNPWRHCRGNCPCRHFDGGTAV